MKKLFLMLAAGCCILSASAELKLREPAGPLQHLNKNVVPQKHQGLTRASEDRINFGYCYDVYTSLGGGEAGVNVAALLEITEDISERFKGNQISAIRVGFGESSSKEINIYMTDDIALYDIQTAQYISGENAEPFYTQKATVTTENGWNEIPLTTPYTFDGKPFYIGYSQVCQNPDKDYPIGMDYTYASTSYSDYVGAGYDTDMEDMEYVHMGSYYGSVCIEVVITGDNLPQYDVAVSNLVLPPFINTNNMFQLDFLVQNNAVKTVENINFDIKINGEVFASDIATFETPVENGQYGWISYGGAEISVPGTEIPVEVVVTQVNGNPDETPVDNSITGTINCAETGFDRNVVAEEFTGTWCGWCPRGLVGMEYMRENYAKDGFIGIAVHATSGTQVDPMNCSTYEPVISAWVSGFPNALMDRTYQFDPGMDTLEEYFFAQKEYPTFAKVGLKAVYNEETNRIDLESTSEFALDINNADYKMAYVLIENQVGPFYQTNYYAGGSNGEMNGWGSLPSRVNTVYNDVARVINTAFGISNSVPSTIQEGTVYTNTATLPLTNVSNLSNCEAIAMLLDTKTYRIVNAYMTNIENAEAGVESLVNDPENVIYKVYNVQGVKVMETEDAASLNNLPKGIYIVNGKKIAITK